jgi:DNA polymerase-1
MYYSTFFLLKGELQMFYHNPKILKYQIVDSLPKLKRLCKKMTLLQEFAFDTETNTLKVLGYNKDFSLVGISISWGEYNNYYIPVGHRRYEDYNRQLALDTAVEYLKPVFEREDVRIICQNSKFDCHVLMRVGIHVKTADIFDTMIASWLCDENTPNGLKENSAHYLKVRQEKFNEVTDTVPKEVRKEFGLKAHSRVPCDLVLIDDGYEYALADAFYAWELYLGFMTLLEDEKMHKIYDKLYRPFIRVLFDMEERGVTADIEKLENMSKEIKADIEKLEYQMFEIMGLEFNPSSGQQLAEILFGYIKNRYV